jgi:DNA-binding XRE family transcriptional regulator
MITACQQVGRISPPRWYHLVVKWRQRTEVKAMSLAENLRRLRVARYLSQADLAAKAGVSKPTIARIEGGDYVPYPRTVRALAAALEIDPSELVSAEEVARRGEAAA